MNLNVKGKKCLLVLITLFLFSAFCQGEEQKIEQQELEDLFEYKFNDDLTEVYITGLSNIGDRKSSIKVPATIQGLPVRKVALYGGIFNDSITIEFMSGFKILQGKIGLSCENAKIVLPDGVLAINFRITGRDDTVLDINFPSSLKIIDNGIFSGKIKFSNPVLDLSQNKNLLLIGAEAFKYKDIKSVILPDSLQYIGYDAFFESAIESVNIPSSVQFIGEYAFSSCDNLNKIDFPAEIKFKSITSIENVFSGREIERSLEMQKFFKSNPMQHGSYEESVNLIDNIYNSVYAEAGIERKTSE